MPVFRCLLCGQIIAPYREGDEDQHCADHPDGPVEVANVTEGE